MGKIITLDPSNSPSARLSRWFKHYGNVWRVLLLLIPLSLVGLFAYQEYQKRQERAAQEELWPAYYYVEEERYAQALDGDGIYKGLRWLVSTYPSTYAAQQAHVLMASIYMKQGKPQEALTHLTAFHIQDEIVYPGVLALIGDAYSELAQEEKALTYYKQAINYKSNPFFTPTQLCKAAVLYEKKGELAQAAACYQRICDEFATSNQLIYATKHLARLKALQQATPTAPSTKQ